MEHHSLLGKRANILGLLVECPMKKSVDNCPAGPLRQLSVQEKYKVVLGMNERQMDEIIGFHLKCLHQREKELMWRRMEPSKEVN